MKNLVFFITLSVSFLFQNSCFAQDIKALKGSYGIDETYKLIVWHSPSLKDYENKEFRSFNFGEEYVLSKASKLNYEDRYEITSDGKKYTLFITRLPLVHLDVDTDKLTNRKKIRGSFRYRNGDDYIETSSGIRHRGNLSLSFAKKSFDLEFWTNAEFEESQEFKIGNMRTDDDWILDAMFNEPLRLRSYVATNLWSTIHKPYYAKLEPNAKNGFSVEYVEVFKNNTYYGIYQLSESVDKKQLRLKSHEGTEIRGQMYKADSYKGGPSFTKISEPYDNLFPHWNGWETDYPIINYRSSFEDLSALQELVINGSDAEFKNKISSSVHIDNVIDYFLFVNVIRATDNLGKNYYLARYDKGEPFFFVPWDLDGTLGVIQDGKRIATTDDVLTNGLFKRLIELNPDNYTTRLKKRWEKLRNSEFQNTAIWSNIETIYTQFTKENIYEREQFVWQNKLSAISNEGHYSYIKEWFTNRMKYMDDYINSL